MDLGAPISDVEVTIIEAPEPVTEDTSSNSTDNSTTSNSTSSNDTSSDSGESSTSTSDSGSKKFKLITGGQVTVPGYDPIVLSDAYFNPRLLQNKNTNYDKKALRLAQILTNVTEACMTRPCTLHKQ